MEVGMKCLPSVDWQYPAPALFVPEGQLPFEVGTIVELAAGGAAQASPDTTKRQPIRPFEILDVNIEILRER